MAGFTDNFFIKQKHDTFSQKIAGFFDNVLGFIAI